MRSHRSLLTWVFSFLSALMVCLCICGCNNSDEHKSLVAANERIKDQERLAEDRTQQINELKIQLTKKDADLGKGYDERLTSVKRDAEDREAKLHQIHELKVAQLESTIASLRLELGAVQKERIMLQELLDRKPRVDQAHKVRSGMIEVVLGIFLGMTLIILGLLASRYHLLRRRLEMLVVHSASSYKVLER